MTTNYRPTDPLRTEVRRQSHIDVDSMGAPWTLPINIYAYFDAEGAPLYVGQTKHSLVRHESHRQRATWFWDAAEFRVLDRVYDRATARQVEAETIRHLRPRHNIHHNRNREVAA